MQKTPALPKPTDVGFTNDQANYLNMLVQRHVLAMKSSMDKELDSEMDKIIKQLTIEIDELREEVKTLRESNAASRAGDGSVVSSPGVTPPSNSGQLVTRDAMTAVVKKSQEVITANAIRAASAAMTEVLNKEVLPQLAQTQQLAMRTATQVRYQNDDTADEVNSYRMAAMAESETAGNRRMIGDGRGADSHEIIAGAVRLGFRDDHDD